MIAPPKWRGMEIKSCHWTEPETEWEKAHLKPLPITEEDGKFLVDMDNRAEEVAKKREFRNHIIVYSPFRSAGKIKQLARRQQVCERILAE